MSRMRRSMYTSGMFVLLWKRNSTRPRPSSQRHKNRLQRLLRICQKLKSRTSINQINFISLSPFTWQHEVKYMVHFRLRRECLTVNSIRSLGGVESFHSATQWAVCSPTPPPVSEPVARANYKIHQALRL